MTNPAGLFDVVKGDGVGRTTVEAPLESPLLIIDQYHSAVPICGNFHET